MLSSAAPRYFYTAVCTGCARVTQPETATLPPAYGSELEAPCAGCGCKQVVRDGVGPTPARGWSAHPFRFGGEPHGAPRTAYADACQAYHAARDLVRALQEDIQRPAVEAEDSRMHRAALARAEAELRCCLKALVAAGGS